MYKPVHINLSPNQEAKLKNAIQENKGVVITVDVNSEAAPTSLFLLTSTQENQLKQAKIINRPNLKIKLSRKQVQANAKHEGGFLGTLISLAARALPTILGGLATGIILVELKEQLVEKVSIWLLLIGIIVVVMVYI